MENYINAAIKEAISKARALMRKIPGSRELGPYFQALAATANKEIGNIIWNLESVYNDPDFNDPSNLNLKYSKFKHLSHELSSIENVVIAAMSRKSSDDDFMNKLVLEICSEINYPLQSPVASCLSQKYYHIYPTYNLLCIPLLEAEYLLHLPDIYHELGHPLLHHENLKAEAFQNNLGYFMREVRNYFDKELGRRTLNRASESDFDPMETWLISWIENWGTELFCDLFATYTLGPAYLWSNLHMCTKMSWEVYKLPTFQKLTHPPGEARIKACTYALEMIGGFEEDIKQFNTKWIQFKTIIGQSETSEFSEAIPDQLLRRAVEFSLTGLKQIGCELATVSSQKRVQRALNDAWIEFWKKPETFDDWERTKVQELRKVSGAG